MPTVILQPELLEELKQVAAERALSLEELLATTVRAYLRQIERQKVQAEAAAFRSMHADLVREYPGQYVAIHDGEVVDHDPDFQALHARVRERFGRQPVLLRRVEAAPERELLFRSQTHVADVLNLDV